jgi:hypothetical protein
MKELRWDPEKDQWLQRERGVGFQELTQTRVIAIKQNPVRPYQDVILYEYQDYIWVVPFVDEGDYWFLKTAYPSRKYTRSVRRGEMS